MGDGRHHILKPVRKQTTNPMLEREDSKFDKIQEGRQLQQPQQDWWHQDAKKENVQATITPQAEFLRILQQEQQFKEHDRQGQGVADEGQWPLHQGSLHKEVPQEDNFGREQQHNLKNDKMQAKTPEQAELLRILQQHRQCPDEEESQAMLFGD